MIKYALFDLDGTLGNPYEGVHRCFLYGLDYMGIHEDPDKDMGWIMGPPLRYSYGQFGLNEEECEIAVKKYRELYSTEGVHQAKIYDGMADAIEKLKNSGITLALASCKPTKFCEIMLKDFGLLKYFDFISGASFDKSHDSKEGIIETALLNLDFNKDKEEAVMIGDRCTDIEGAHKNGILGMGVAFGFGSVDELINADSDFIAGSPFDITDTILEYNDTIGKLIK